MNRVNILKLVIPFIFLGSIQTIHSSEMPSERGDSMLYNPKVVRFIEYGEVWDWRNPIDCFNFSMSILDRALISDESSIEEKSFAIIGLAILAERHPLYVHFSPYEATHFYINCQRSLLQLLNDPAFHKPNLIENQLTAYSYLNILTSRSSPEMIQQVHEPFRRSPHFVGLPPGVIKYFDEFYTSISKNVRIT